MNEEYFSFRDRRSCEGCDDEPVHHLSQEEVDRRIAEHRERVCAKTEVVVERCNFGRLGTAWGFCFEGMLRGPFPSEEVAIKVRDWYLTARRT